MMKNLSTPLFITLALILFFLDIITFALIEKHLLSSLLCLYLIQTLKPFSWLRTGIVLVLLACQCLIFYGSLGIPLLYFITLALLASLFKRTCYLKEIHRYGILIIAMLGQTLLVEWLGLGLPISPAYTFSQIFGTLMVLLLLTRLGI